MAWLTEILYKESHQSEEIDISTCMATGTAFVVSFGNIGGIVGPQLYTAYQSHLISIIFLTIALLLIFLVKRL